MKVLFQADAIESLNILTDTTLCIAKEALKKNFEVWFYLPEYLTHKKNKLFTIAHKITSISSTKTTFESAKEILVNDADILFIRQNPPFNINYITYTYLLDLLQNTLVVNSSTGLRNFTEKLSILMFPQFIPPTTVTSNEEEAINFLNEHKSVVCKPLYEFGGHDIIKFDLPNLELFAAHFKELYQKYKAPLMLQRFIPNVAKGDTRVMMVNGKPITALKKIPKQGSIKSNLCAGGEAHKTTLTAQEILIAEHVGPELLKHNIIFAGLDIIDGYLTEINVTSPTVVLAINKLYNLENTTTLEYIIWEAVLEQYYKKLSR